MANQCNELTKELGYKTRSYTYGKHVLMNGKVFDPSKPDEYVNSFAISNL